MVRLIATGGGNQHIGIDQFQSLQPLTTERELRQQGFIFKFRRKRERAGQIDAGSRVHGIGCQRLGNGMCGFGYQPPPQRVIDDVLETVAVITPLTSDQGDHIVIEGEGGTHHLAS